MAFILSGGNVVSFAEYSDVTSADQRLFEANEGIADENSVEDLLSRATTRILYLIRNTDWWKSYYIKQSGTNLNPAIFTSGLISVPIPNANNIKDRQADFTDLCVYYTLSELILPKIADYGNVNSAEVKKIGVYKEKFSKLFGEIIEDGAWYDFSGDGSINASEKMPTTVNIRRLR